MVHARHRGISAECSELGLIRRGCRHRSGARWFQKGEYLRHSKGDGVRRQAASADEGGREGSFRDEAATLTTLLGQTADRLWALDTDFRFTHIAPIGTTGEPACDVRAMLGEHPWNAGLRPAGNAQWTDCREALAGTSALRDAVIRHDAAKGEPRYFSVTGIAVTDAEGRVAGYRGTAREVTGRESQDEQVREFMAAMDASPDHIYVAEPEPPRMLYVNDTACRDSGYSKVEYLAMHPAAVAGLTEAGLEALYARVIASGESGLTTEPQLRTSRDGRRKGWWEAHWRAVDIDGRTVIVTTSREVTRRKLAEDAMRQAKKMYAAASAANDTLLRVGSPDELYRGVCKAAVQAGEFVVAGVVLVDADTGNPTLAATAVGDDRDARAALSSLDLSSGAYDAIVSHILGGGGILVSNDFDADEYGRPWHAFAEAEGIKSIAVLPLVRRGSPFGLLLLGSASRGAFGEDNVNLLERMTENIAFALDNFEREARRQRAEAELRASEAKYRTILQNMEDGFFEVDLRGNYTFVNDALGRMHGVSPEDLIGVNYRQYMDEETAQVVKSIYNRVYRTGEPEHLAEWDYVRQDGSRGVFESTVELIRDDTGNPVGFRGVSRDRTEQRLAEQALRASEEKYRSILNNIEEAYYEVNLRGDLVLVNAAFQRLLGYEEGELIGMNNRQFMRPGVAEEVYRAFNEVYRTGTPTTSFDWEMIRKDGTLCTGEGSIHLIRDHDGNPAGFRGMLRDVTERRREERLLALEHAVTRSLAEAETTRKTMQEVMRIVCESERWDAGGYFRFEDEKGTARLIVGWSGPEATAGTRKAYETAPGDVIPAGGLMSEVFRTEEPLWVEDVTRDSRTTWRKRLEQAGQRAIFAFPVKADGKVIGTFAFGSGHIRPPDQRLLDTMAVVGNQAGQFLQRRDAEQELRESEARFRSLTELSSDWYWEQDTEFRFIRLEGRHTVNGESLEGDRCIGRSRWETGLEIQEDGGWEAHMQRLNAHREYRDVVFRRTLSDGSHRFTSISGEPIFDSRGGFRGYRGVGGDITERKRAEAHIQYLATHDSLSDLPNRVLFNQMLSMTIETAQRYERRFAVMFIDLDRFKLVNDSLGHGAGDTLLKEVAERLRRSVRSSDVIARMGGDEFVVLLQEVASEKDAETVARKILHAVIEPTVLAGQECRVTASIGICIYPEHGEDVQTLMKHADAAMYVAKEEGKNNYQFYSPDIKAQSFERLALESSLRGALEAGQFVLYYQSKLDLKSDRITGVEALVRWEHPQLGTVPPSQFIPLAEETGLIVPLGKWVLRTACEQNMAWQREGLAPTTMAVNLSPRQFTDPNLLSDIAQVLEETGMLAGHLELELTETMVMQHPERAVSLLKSLREMGVRLAMDDFGVGYSSLAQLKGFPVDTLKVDRSFIRNLPQSEQDSAITQAIIAMAKTLSLTVVAEGVETAEQAAFLRGISCDQSQGFYFSRPAPAEEVSKFLRDHQNHDK